MTTNPEKESLVDGPVPAVLFENFFTAYAVQEEISLSATLLVSKGPKEAATQDMRVKIVFYCDPELATHVIESGGQKILIHCKFKSLVGKDVVLHMDEILLLSNTIKSLLGNFRNMFQPLDVATGLPIMPSSGGPISAKVVDFNIYSVYKVELHAVPLSGNRPSTMDQVVVLYKSDFGTLHSMIVPSLKNPRK